LRRACQDGHLGLRFCERATGFQPADDVHLSARPVREAGIAEDRPIGHEEVHGPPGARAVEARRRDADDRVGHVVQHEPLADNARVSGKSSLPEGVAQHDDRVASRGGVFAREEEASHVRSECQHTEIARGHDGGQKLLSALGVGQPADVTVTGQLAEHRRVFAEIDVVGVGKLMPFGSPVHEPTDPEKSLWLGHARRRREERRVRHR
jgi:hypothetical protein